MYDHLPVLTQNRRGAGGGVELQAIAQGKEQNSAGEPVSRRENREEEAPAQKDREEEAHANRDEAVVKAERKAAKKEKKRAKKEKRRFLNHSPVRVCRILAHSDYRSFCVRVCTACPLDILEVSSCS